MTSDARAAAINLTLYGRSGCHLCEDMEEAVLNFQREWGFVLERLDVDGDPALAEAYGRLVPVLKDGDLEICHYFLDPKRLREHLAHSLNQL